MSFVNGTVEEWLDAMGPREAATVRELLAIGQHPEAVAINWLFKMGAENTFPFGGATVSEGYYQRVRDELHKLICGDPSYDNLRKEIAALAKHKTKVVGMIAAALGATVGLSAVALVPVVSIILSIVAQVGVNAWCKVDMK